MMSLANAIVIQERISEGETRKDSIARDNAPGESRGT